MYGIGVEMRKSLKEKEMDIDESRILELQGYQQLDTSNLWVYYAGQHLELIEICSCS